VIGTESPPMLWMAHQSLPETEPATKLMGVRVCSLRCYGVALSYEGYGQEGRVGGV
jgi:hypothetical protein